MGITGLGDGDAAEDNVGVRLVVLSVFVRAVTSGNGLFLARVDLKGVWDATGILQIKWFGDFGKGISVAKSNISSLHRAGLVDGENRRMKADTGIWKIWDPVAFLSSCSGWHISAATEQDYLVGDVSQIRQEYPTSINPFAQVSKIQDMGMH
ncbi:hypothetical protein BJ684DRAFT_14283 [Piptocephalis cylindrospora]|uniref:Uncharacterized protein n=1 Tax=Piptocephalis cylindrospora TaxID=1907219 RepID=A0A4P9Y8X7_9FUNG|nr:hypothetical protein BJ684DRAFT_14283 [Piptocephalis cylindrospora]|eukprot:RKP15495.1 hypothetical protein BJ684DRAFT_14283 [Piptocephalis cylindrospora]